jgi:hypothetical protein
MTDSSLPPPDTPHELLTDFRDLTRRVLAVQRGTWFPLLLLAILTLGGILVARFTFSIQTVTCPEIHSSIGTSTDCFLFKHGSPVWSPVYWTLGLVLAYAATAFFYIRRSSNRGVGTPVRPYVLAGIVLVGLVAATEFWTIHHTTTLGAPVDFWGLHLAPNAELTRLLERFTGDAAAVGLPLLLLSWLERNRALLLFTLAYLVIELAPITTDRTGWTGIAPTSPWSPLPRLAIPGVFLLLGALGFALTQSPRRRTTS